MASWDLIRCETKSAATTSVANLSLRWQRHHFLSRWHYDCYKAHICINEIMQTMAGRKVFLTVKEIVMELVKRTAVFICVLAMGAALAACKDRSSDRSSTSPGTSS